MIKISDEREHSRAQHLLSLQQAAETQVRIIDKLIMQPEGDKKQSRPIEPKIPNRILPDAEQFRKQLVDFRDQIMQPSRG